MSGTGTDAGSSSRFETLRGPGSERGMKLKEIGRLHLGIARSTAVIRITEMACVVRIN